MWPEERSRPAGNGAAPRSGWRAEDSIREPGDAVADQLSIDVGHVAGTDHQHGAVAGLDEGRVRRDQGVAAATLNTWSPWRQAAHAFVSELPPGRELTSDDVVEAVGLPLGSRNAVGALTQALIKSGLIEWTGRVAQSTRASRHGGWIKIYVRTCSEVAR